MSTSTNVGSSAKMRSIAFLIFAVGALLVNAALTAQFGYQFCGGWFGATLMLMFFDFAAASWYVSRMQTGLSGTQRATAKMLSIFTIVGSTLVSIIQVLMTTQIIDLSGYYQVIGLFGVALITITTAANFLGLFFFQYHSVNEQKIESNEELAAQTADEVQQITNEAHAKAMARARLSLTEKTDAIGDRIASDVEREFLRSMDCLDMFEPLPSSTASVKTEAKAMTEQELTNLLDARLAKALEAFQGAAAGAKKGKKSKGEKAKTSPTAGDGAPPPPADAGRQDFEFAFDLEDFADDVEYEEVGK